MSIEIRKAARSKAKLRLAISGPSGSGKTYSALVIASGICPLENVCVIDTENGSADLYANLGGYSVIPLKPPYQPQKYIEAIHAAEQAGFELIVVDSLTHAWSGEGGLLDQQGKATDSKYKGNSWAAWREITPLHNQLVETMLKSPAHIIATMRSKTEYVQEDNGGKKRIVKVGTAPIQRDGMEYEFTVVFDMSIDHIANVSKDRTTLFDGQYFVPNKNVGDTLLEWLKGSAPIAPEAQPVQIQQNVQPQEQAPAAQQAPTAVNPNAVPDQIDYMNLFDFLWEEKGKWARNDLMPYVEKRYGKKYFDVEQTEFETLCTEFTAYLNLRPDAVLAEFRNYEPIPF